MILEKLGALGLIAKVTGVVAFLTPAMALSPGAPPPRSLPLDIAAQAQDPSSGYPRAADDGETALANADDSEDAVMGDAHSAAERICALHTVADVEIRAIHASMVELRADLAAVAVDR